jgi:hypothetical protein
MGSGATSRYALEYPIGTDPVNIPSDIETLANDLDGLLFSLRPVAKSANYQATIGQLVQMSGANTVSSPAAGSNVMWGAQNVSSGTAVTVAAATGLLNLPGNYGAGSISLPHQGDWAIFVCDGTNHNLISGSPSIMASEIVSIIPSFTTAVFRGNSAGSLTLTTSPQAVPLTVATFDPSSGFNSGAGGWNPPATGWYRITVTFSTNAVSNTTLYFEASQGSTTVLIATAPVLAAGGYFGLLCDDIVHLTVGAGDVLFEAWLGVAGVGGASLSTTIQQVG